MNMKETVIFQALGEQLRLRALALIVMEGELCICELMEALDAPQPKISRHMSVMREAGLLVARRHAQWVYYGLNPSLPAWQQRIVEAAAEGAGDDELVRRGRERLKRMQKRPRPRSCAVPATGKAAPDEGKGG